MYIFIFIIFIYTGNGEKYVGAFDRNMKNGKGTMYYDGGDISLSGQWFQDKPINIHTKRTYKKDGIVDTSYVNHNHNQPDIYPELQSAADETIKFIETERHTPTPSPPTPSLQTPTPTPIPSPPTQSTLLPPPPKSRITRDMRINPSKPLEMNDT